MAKGIFKSNGRVQVSFRRHKAPVSETNYVAKGYQPPLKDVPTEEQFKASRKGGGPSEPAKNGLSVCDHGFGGSCLL